MVETPKPHAFRETDVSLRDYAELLVGGSDKHLVELAMLFDQKLGGLKDLLQAEITGTKEVLDERDRLYKERDESRRTAVDAALMAVKEQTKSTFDGSEKAIVKAEEAQKAYNASHNDLSRKMDEQYKAMTPQSEARLKWDATDKEMAEVRKDVISTRENAQKEITGLRDSLMREIAGLRESRSEHTGARQQQGDTRTNWLAIVSLLGFLILAIGFVLKAESPPAAAAAPQIIYVPAAPGTLLPSTPAPAGPGR